MIGDIKLANRPFHGKIIIKGSSAQHITLNAKAQKIYFNACSVQRQRIFFHVCKFMAETIEANASKEMDVEHFRSVMQVWVDDICNVSFRGDYNNQPAFEKKAISDGKRCVLTALGLKPTDSTNLDEDHHPTPSGELETASEPVQVAEPTTKAIDLPISNGRAITLTFPIDLTKDEAELIAHSSLEYLKALLLAQHKE
ncbi:hypothetical protein GHU64_06725 [Pseudomonas aeruginosa]|nr:hypothetical protein [Pseudomonas aeruginosa]